MPELEQATITLSLERIVALMAEGGLHPLKQQADPASTILEVPTSGVPPESGLVI